jgi:hypothetical protein
MIRTVLLAIGLALVSTAPAAATSGDCSIVIIKGWIARTPEGRIVRLSEKANVIIFGPKAGHLVACWDEKAPAAAADLPPRMLGEWCLSAKSGNYLPKVELPCRRNDPENLYVMVSPTRFYFNNPCRILAVRPLPPESYQYEPIEDRILTVRCADPMNGPELRHYWLWVSRDGSRRLGVQDVTNNPPLGLKIHP